MIAGLKNRFDRLLEQESLKPDLNRALRATAALMVPLVLGELGRIHLEVAFAVLAALSIAMVDVRGAYSLRFTLLLAMTAVLGASAALGGAWSSSIVLAVAGMGIISLLCGLWRHLSPDYGPSLVTSSTLLYALAISAAPSAAAPERHLLATLAGGLWGLLLQVALWPFRPQHPLRVAVSDAWIALSDAFGAVAPREGDKTQERHERILAAETALRALFEHARTVLGSAGSLRTGTLAVHLGELVDRAVQFQGDIEVLNAAIESLMGRADFARVEASFLPVLTALGNTARTVALAVVSRQPEHLATYKLRTRRLTNLLETLDSRVRLRMPGAPGSALLSDAAARIVASLGATGTALRATMERADEKAAFPQELFEIKTWTLRPLASALNFSLRPDPGLIRYTLRVAFLTMVSIVAAKLLQLHHGYWLPFTIVVVLQPDYGSTRQRAAQRVVGTIVGVAVASALLGLHPPPAVITAAIALTSFVFVYYLRRNYGISVVFITLFVVLLTESGGTVDIAFTLERLAVTVAGGVMALGAALLFWPEWERSRFPPILAAALRANRDYLRAVLERVVAGRPSDGEVVRARRLAESANAGAFSSLRRMSGDPGNRPDEIQRGAALVNGNQRIVRVLNILARQLRAAPPLDAGAVLSAFGERASRAFDALALAAEKGERPQALETLRTELDTMEPPVAPPDAPHEEAVRLSWISSQLGLAGTELSAMLLA